MEVHYLLRGVYVFSVNFCVDCFASGDQCKCDGFCKKMIQDFV